MTLTQEQFEVLVIIERNKKISNKQISELLGLPDNIINNIISDLFENKLIDKENIITTNGLETWNPTYI